MTLAELSVTIFVEGSNRIERFGNGEAARRPLAQVATQGSGRAMMQPDPHLKRFAAWRR